MDKINVRHAKQAHHRVLLLGDVWFGNQVGWDGLVSVFKDGMILSTA